MEKGKFVLKSTLILAGLLWCLTSLANEDASFCVRSLNLHGSLYFKSSGEGAELVKRLSDPQYTCPITHVKEVWVKSQKKELVDLLQTLGGGRLQPEFDSSRNDGKTIGMLSFVQGDVGEWGSALFDVMQDDLKSTLTSLIGVRKGFSYVYTKMGPQKTPVLAVNAILSASSEEVRLGQISQLAEWLTSQMPFSASVILTIKLNAPFKSLEWRYLTRVLPFKDALTISLNCMGCEHRHNGTDFLFVQAHPTLDLVVTKAQVVEGGDDIQVRFLPRLQNINEATEGLDLNSCEARKRIARVTVDEAQRSVAKSGRYVKLKLDLERVRGSLERQSLVSDNLCGVFKRPTSPPEDPSPSVQFSQVSQGLFSPTH